MTDVFAEPGADAGLLERAEAAGAAVHPLRAGVLDRAAVTVTPQPVAAVATILDRPLSDALAGPAAPGRFDLVVVLPAVADPGNAGTLVRSADASGARAVVVCAGSTDVYNPKVVRATAGSLFRVPLVVAGDVEAVSGALRERGYRLVGAVAAGGRPYDEVALELPVALILGSEAHGLPPGFADIVDERATVPMAPGVDSLNVAMAGTVLCFEVRRRHGR